MKRLLSVVVAAVALSAGVIPSASAQDILRAFYSRAPVAGWTGFYAGANGGYAWGKSGMSDPSGLLATGSTDMNGAILGGQVGGLLQSGYTVLGFEADLQGSWQKGSFVAPATFQGAPYFQNETNSIRWFGTGRARFGIAKDQFLLYGTGGLAFGEFRNDEVVTGALTGTNSFAAYRFGWAAGGGVEVMLARNWTVRAEYLHVDLGAFDQKFNVTIAGTTTVSTLHYKVYSDVARVGVNYYFR
jgi:outer membrane immunogenic protein